MGWLRTKCQKMFLILSTDMRHIWNPAFVRFYHTCGLSKIQTLRQIWRHVSMVYPYVRSLRHKISERMEWSHGRHSHTESRAAAPYGWLPVHASTAKVVPNTSTQVKENVSMRLIAWIWPGYIWKLNTKLEFGHFIRKFLNSLLLC